MINEVRRKSSRRSDSYIKSERSITATNQAHSQAHKRVSQRELRYATPKSSRSSQNPEQMICDVCINHYLVDQKKQRTDYERVKDERVSNIICKHNFDQIADADRKRKEQLARFQKEQMEANQRHVAEKERRKAIQDEENKNFVPVQMFGEENRMDKSRQNEQNEKFRNELKKQIVDQASRKNAKRRNEDELDQLPGLKFGEFEDKYAAMKARYMQSLKEQLLEKEKKGRRLNEEKSRDMMRIKEEMSKQIQEEKAEQRAISKTKKAFFDEEARRLKEIQGKKKVYFYINSYRGKKKMK